jgi:aspartyl-tRNA(Asn)/glutamyl-tRNA(Gln) amidotransferase subunit B
MSSDLFRELLDLIKADTITDKSAVEILRMILDAVKEGRKPERPYEIVKRLGLAKTSGDQITALIHDVIAEQKAAVDDYYAGKSQALNFLVGQVMKKCRGRADPGYLNKLLREILDKKV